MNVLSLFSGIGGLDLGLERAGMTIVGQVEIDPWCRKILAKHWPEVPRHDDVRTCVEWWLSQPRPAVDLVCGGVPCQPVSQAGLRLAQSDPRWLWPATIDAVGALRPGYVLLENVPGLLARGMGDVVGHLAEVGYDTEWDCVPASAVGAPHRRDRVWIVAYPQSSGCRPFRPDSTAETGPDPVAGHAGEQPAILADANGRRLEVSTELDGQPQPDPADRDTRRGHADRRRHQMADTDGQGSSHRRGAPRPPFMAQSQRLGRNVADTHREPLGWAAITRRQCDHWPAEPDVGRVAHGIPRRVDRLRGLGNAVVPQVAEHIGRLIMEAAA